MHLFAEKRMRIGILYIAISHLNKLYLHKWQKCKKVKQLDSQKTFMIICIQKIDFVSHFVQMNHYTESYNLIGQKYPCKIGKISTVLMKVSIYVKNQSNPSWDVDLLRILKTDWLSRHARQHPFKMVVSTCIKNFNAYFHVKNQLYPKFRSKNLAIR